MSGPYAEGDRVLFQGVVYTVAECYAAEDGGWDLRMKDYAGHYRWCDWSDVKPVRATVVETEAQGDLGL